MFNQVFIHFWLIESLNRIIFFFNVGPFVRRKDRNAHVASPVSNEWITAGFIYLCRIKIRKEIKNLKSQTLEREGGRQQKREDGRGTTTDAPASFRRRLIGHKRKCYHLKSQNVPRPRSRRRSHLAAMLKRGCWLFLTTTCLYTKKGFFVSAKRSHGSRNAQDCHGHNRSGFDNSGLDPPRSYSPRFFDHPFQHL